jgi:hypothetical protein
MGERCWRRPRCAHLILALQAYFEAVIASNEASQCPSTISGPGVQGYLAQRAPRLPLLVLNRLREAVIAGPTEQSIPGCTADYLAEYSAEKISRRLGKLREGAVTVPLPTEEQPEDMGDVQTVRVVHRGPDNDRADDLLELSPEAVADALLAAEGRFSASRQLADLCTRKPELALACIPLLAEQRDGGWEGWGGLNELARVPNPAPALTTIARVTADHPQLAKGTLLWALAQIMQGWGGQAGSDTAFRTDYLNVWRYLWHTKRCSRPQGGSPDSPRRVQTGNRSRNAVPVAWSASLACWLWTAPHHRQPLPVAWCALL